MPLGSFLDEASLPGNEQAAVAWAVNHMTVKAMREEDFWRSLQSSEAEVDTNVSIYLSLIIFYLFSCSFRYKNQKRWHGGFNDEGVGL